MKKPKKQKNDGKQLEKIVDLLCKQLSRGATVSKNIYKTGRISKTRRQIDTWIEGKIGPCPVSICVDAKDYSEPVDVNVVSAMVTNLEDFGANLGAIVCPKGFTEGAKNLADQKGIQLLVPYSPDLENELAKILVPVRWVTCEIANVQFQISHRTAGPAELPMDLSKLRVKVGTKFINLKQLTLHAWNTKQIEQRPGTQIVEFNAMTLINIDEPSKVHYFEISIRVKVVEKFQLALLPASGFKNARDGKQTMNLNIDTADIETWPIFDSFEDLDKAADSLENPHAGVKKLEMRPEYQVDLEGIEFDLS